MKRYLDFEKFTAWDFLNRWFCIDSRDVTIFLNDGMIKGSGLNNWTKEPMSGYNMAELAFQKKYNEIESYIIAETKAYIDFLKVIRIQLTNAAPSIKRSLGIAKIDMI